MGRCYQIALFSMVILTAFGAPLAGAVPAKGDAAPSFTAKDIAGRDVDLATILKAKPDMVILYFFTTAGGEEMAKRLSTIHEFYGRDKVKIVAFGVKEDQAALKNFADQVKIEYYILPDDAVSEQYGPMKSLPLTFILKNDREIVKVVRGSGQMAGYILTEVANTYLMQGNSDDAVAVANMAKESGEDANAATEVMGFALAEAGKLDDAEEAFGLIGSTEGQARVALDRGDYDKAVSLASQSQTGYSETIKAIAYTRQGKMEDAAAAFDAATQQPSGNYWKDSQAINGQGRLLHEQGSAEEAIQKYNDAIAMDPFNTVALSNQGAAYREKGDLEKASAVLQEAQSIRDDDLVTVMLQQVKKEMEEANDIKRGELIRKQIAELSARFEEMKKAGTATPTDPWSTKPLVLAFLPSSDASGVFFERAGTDVVLRRELQNQVRNNDAVHQVVEREMLDKLLQELDLGSSELADKNTQLQLGKLLTAGYLGFIDFAKAGDDILMYLRLIDTETTSITLQLSRNIRNASGIAALAQEMSLDMVKQLVEERELKGLVADASDSAAVLINLGAAHGIKAGQKFTVVQEGDPIKAGGRVIGYRSKTVGILEVTGVEETFATCKVVKLNEGVQLAQDMRIKAAK